MKKVFLFTALVLSLASQAQKVTGKLNLQKGQKYEVVTETKSNSTQEAMGQSIETSTTSTFTEVYDVQEAGKNGSAVEHKVKRLVINSEGGMGQGMTFDSEKPEDRKGEIGSLLDKKVLKNKYMVMIDEVGRVTGVKADDDNPNGKPSDDNGMAAMMMQQLGARAELPKAGDKTMFAVLPAKEVGVGDQWMDSTNKEGIANTRTYKVTGITDAEITVEYVSKSKIDKTMEVMGQTATIAGTENGLGTIVIDRKTGVVKSINGNSTNEANVEVQGMTIPVTAKTSLKVMVTPL